MPLVPAICSQCGALLQVDPSKDAAICPYCETSFVNEKVINNYNIRNISQIETLQTDVVILNDTTSIDDRVRAGETFIKLGKYQAAQKKFQELIQMFPYDYRSWWGLIRAKTQDFNSYMDHSSKFSEISDLYENVCKTADVDNLLKLRVMFDEYKQHWDKNFTELTMAKMSELSFSEEEYEQKREEIELNNEKINVEINMQMKVIKKIQNVFIVIFVFIFSLLIIYGIIEATSVFNFFLGILIYGGMIFLIFYLIMEGINYLFSPKIVELQKEQNDLGSQIQQLEIEYKNIKHKIEEKYSWL